LAQLNDLDGQVNPFKAPCFIDMTAMEFTFAYLSLDGVTFGVSQIEGTLAETSESLTSF
jgi:hypothetical protein